MLVVRDMSLDTVDFYEEPGFSAKSLHRSDISRLLVEVKAGEIGCVMIAKLVRITRSEQDLV